MNKILCKNIKTIIIRYVWKVDWALEHYDYEVSHKIYWKTTSIFLGEVVCDLKPVFVVDL